MTAEQKYQYPKQVGLKYLSLLQFDEGRHETVIRSNLKALYGVERAPCDTRCAPPRPGRTG